MAAHISSLRAAISCATLILISFTSVSHAQRFADPEFRPYLLRNVAPAGAEDSLRRFLADRIEAGDPIEIVADARTGRLLVSGPEQVHQMVGSFLQAIDQPAAQPELAQATPRTVRGYGVPSAEELSQRVDLLRKIFAQNRDVRIAADERTQQVVVHASEDVHRQIIDNWNNPVFFQQANSTPQRLPESNQVQQEVAAQNVNQQLQLENISWQELLKSLRGVQGQNGAITSPQDGTLELNLVAGPNGPTTRMQIDQNNQVVQISGSEPDTDRWKRVVQAMDSQPANPGELQRMGRLGDAQPSTITRTIAMLGGGAGQQAMRPIAQRGPEWGGNVVQQMFGQQRQPVQVAQAQGGPPPAQPGGQQGGDVAQMLMGGDGAGSFLGPVRIEFLEGTDIFIVRGQQRDVDRVMQIINDIEQLTVDTEPTVEVYTLKHANSEALAALINQLNATPLAARQGDISVSPLVKPNALLLIGRDAGVAAVKKIIEKLDVEASGGDQFRVFKLVHLPAVDAERTIYNLYNANTQTTGTEEIPTLGPRVRAVADFRSNSLAVQGSPRDIEEIAELLKEIDVIGSSTVSEVRVFSLKNALAEEVAEVLNDTLGTDESSQGQQGFGNQGQTGGGTGNANTQPFSSRRALMLEMKVLDAEAKKLLDQEILESGILSNVVVSSNDRANSVVVVSPKGSMDLIAEIIRQLDELPAQEAEIRVFAIENGDAATLIEMLDTLFAQDENDDGPLVQSAAGTGESTLVPLRFSLDPRTNSIVASGNAADLRVVEAILLKLDSSDVSRRKNTVYELQIQQADSVAAAISDFVALKREAVQGIAADTISQYELLDQEVVVVSEPDSNKLIISATEPFYSDIMDVIRELDRRPDMVMVQVLIAEVALNSTEEMGVELGIQDSLLFNRSVVGADGVAVPGFNFNNQALGGNTIGEGTARDKVAGQAIADFGLGRSNGELGYGGLVLSASNESVSVLIRALQEARRLDVISRPQVMMLNNTTGEVQIGAQVPFITGTTNNGFNIQNEVEFQQVGLILSVTPRISPDGLVVLDVLAEKSDLGAEEDGIPIAVTDGQVLRAPQINTTRARTYVTARDGQTVILGGLITKERAAFERKVPYLADIPFFGRLFRTDGVSEQRTELLVILTPHIIRDEADVDRINSEEYARMSWCLGNVIETHGDIGPGRMWEEDVVYSDMVAPSAGTPAEATPIQTEGTIENWQTPATSPAPMPQSVTPVPDAAYPPPTNSSPPVPSLLPNLPQVKQDRNMMLDAPRNAGVFPKSGKGLFSRRDTLGPPRATVNGGVHQASFDLGPPTEAPTRHALYRFDEVPEEN